MRDADRFGHRSEHQLALARGCVGPASLTRTCRGD
jgi:hypothetical protein